MKKPTEPPPLSVAIAIKLASATNLTQPRLAQLLEEKPRMVELLWHLEDGSRQPGGLKKLKSDFLRHNKHPIGPAALASAAPGDLTAAQCLEVWKQIPPHCRIYILPNEAWQLERERSQLDWTDKILQERKVLPKEEERLKSALVKLNRQAFEELAMQFCELHLADYLLEICEEVSRPLGKGETGETGEPLDNPPWYFTQIIPALFAAMDAHAQRIRQTVAATALTVKLEDALEFCRSAKALCLATGTARAGKTESLTALCHAWPGRYRLVTVPWSNCTADLFRAFAQAIGLESEYHPNPRKVRETVEFVVKHSGLAFVCDEAHHLFNQTLIRSVAPMRLNWLRTEIVDRKTPVLLVSTPQNYNQALSKFTRRTGFNISQWVGRIARTTILPENLEFADLLEIAKCKCPDVDARQQSIIASYAELCKESYIAAVENIFKLARHFATRAHRVKITDADIDLAATEIVPSDATTAPPIPKPIAAPAAPKPRAVRPRNQRTATSDDPVRSARPATPAPVLASMSAPSREIAPTLIPA